jgi:hypothetical protein
MSGISYVVYCPRCKKQARVSYTGIKECCGGSVSAPSGVSKDLWNRYTHDNMYSAKENEEIVKEYLRRTRQADER